ncbi:MAG: HEAT repeat domain-containing protein [Thermodesulfobacteriota bacterium]
MANTANTERLLEELKDEDPLVRRLACEEIGDSGALAAFVDPLTAALGDLDHGVSEAAMNALMSIGGTEVAEAVAPLLRASEARLRNRAMEILISTGRASTPMVSAMLGDKDDDVVKFAVDILAATGEAASVAEVAGLTGHPNANVRGAVALYMGMARPYGAARYIMEAIGDEEQWVRFSAVEALGLLGDLRQLEPLLEILREENGVVKDAALDALSRMATTANSYEILMTMRDFINEDDTFPVASIVEILEKAADAAWDVNKCVDLREKLFKIFDSATLDLDIEKRKTAIRGLVLLRDHRGISRVLEFMDSQDELDEDTEEYVISAMAELCAGRELPAEVLEGIRKGGKNTITLIRLVGRLRAVEALPVLENCLARGVRDEARAILFTVESIGSAESVDMLYKSIYSSDGHVRKIAARTLARVVGEEASDNLFAMLIKERYRDVIEGITDALAGMGREKVRSGFTELLACEREDLREMGCRGLGVMGGEASTEPLKKAIEDKDPAVRKTAYVSLAMLGVPDALEPVIQGLRLGDEEMCIAMMDSMNAVITDELREALRDKLSDSSLWVRYHAVTLLGDMLDRDAEDTFIDMLRDDEPPVQAAVAGALARIDSKRARPILKSMYEDAEPSMRDAIVKAMEVMGC